MKRTHAVPFLLVLVACAPVDTPTFKVKHAEQRGKVDANGLRFVIMPDPSTTLVEVDVRFDVGAREDPKGKAGLAHLVEHLLFQIRPEGPGTPTLMDHLSQIAVARNAYTTWDKTHYMTLAPAASVEALLQIEATRLYYGCNEIPETEFAREREVVRNELRQRYGSPQGQIYPKALATIYPAGHAYARIPGGDDEQVASLTLADACEFVKQNYTPDRATLIVSGGVDVAATARMIGKWFGKLPRRTPAPRVAVTPLAGGGGKRTVIELDIERPVVMIAWPLPDQTTAAGEAAADAMQEALSSVARSADEYGFATDVGFTGALGGTNGAATGVVLELPSMGKVDQAVEFTYKAARNADRLFKGFGASFEEWRARRQARLVTSMEPLFEGRNDVVADLAQFRQAYDWGANGLFLFQELDAIRGLQESAVRGAAAGALDPSKARVIVFAPSRAGVRGDKRSAVTFSPSTHDAADQSAVDPAEANRPLALPKETAGLAKARRFTLGNGMAVALLPVDGMPIVNAQLVFDVGAASAPDRPLLAAAAANLLQFKYDEVYSAGEAMTSLPARLGRAGVSIGCGAGQDTTTCYARGINIYVDDIIEGLEQLAKRGEYDQQAVERAQKRLRTQYKLRATRDQNELARQQQTALVGAEHPYAKTAYVSPSGIGKLGRDALWAFRDKHYSAANATLVVVGGFDEKKVEAAIRARFGDWGKGHDDAPIVAPAAARTRPVFTGVVGEAGPQLAISIMYPSAPGIGDQHAARLVLAELLDMCAAKVRETLGATYGITAQRVSRRGPSYYEIAGTADAPRAGEALEALRGAIDSLRTGDFAVDFVRARRKVVRDLLGATNTSTVLADRLARIGAFGLPADYYTTLLDQLATLTPAQVKAVIATELDPKSEIVTALGDRPTIEKAFARANLHDVTIVEPD